MLAAALNYNYQYLCYSEYSYVGASVATVATQIFSFSFLLYFACKEGYPLPKNMIIHLSKILFAWLRNDDIYQAIHELPLLLLILLAAIAYLAIIFFTGVRIRQIYRWRGS